MYRNRFKIFLQLLLFITCLSAVLGLKEGPDRRGLHRLTDEFKISSTRFAETTIELQHAVKLIDEKNPETITLAKNALRKSRLAYKRIEFFMDYFFPSSALIYNRPAKVEVDEPYMEYQEPSGFQVMEAALFDQAPRSKKQLAEQAEVLNTSAADLPALLYAFVANDQQILESIRLELVRVITLSITGYDAPELKSGITESYQSILTIKTILSPYLRRDQRGSELLLQHLNTTLSYLQLHPDFDSFDRMSFLTGYALPLQEQLSLFIKNQHLLLNSKSALNYEAKHIYSTDAILPEVFPGAAGRTTGMVSLGKKLFLDKSLSGNLRRSCASCHHPERYFSEDLKTSITFDGKGTVQRNAPTLLYSGFQYSQFWDGRAKSLQEQIKGVISNPTEMNGNHEVIIARINKSEYYKKYFLKYFADSAAQPISIGTIADALAAYIGSLSPRNSAFDRYMNGDKNAMKAKAVSGFNLFMGKGQCGSCHFAPLFNGLIPPYYKLTEYEVLGTPGNNDFNQAKKDMDRGRYDFFPISYYEAAFKTPTVRNVVMTAPYMHNGALKDLYQVVEFYNKGGGAGLGLTIPGQTLSAKPLNLSKKEVGEIIAFLESLTDKL
ncbi:cytochrome c peroxidase [Pedobacter cryoconitis]|uniref:Cytochrome c peroxidase n=1 Tax=Pedobacter cryoconitis TaxID=188932 RepID=A0A7X0MGY9_9SPHI|nr:cytochrome c peroxidase [Pedobacter cryoconitis]MBB6498574.1 cytochrome c peroxidase [Pedobacter cryoconitis]